MPLKLYRLFGRMRNYDIRVFAQEWLFWKIGKMRQCIFGICYIFNPTRNLLFSCKNFANSRTKLNPGAESRIWCTALTVQVERRLAKSGVVTSPCPASISWSQVSHSPASIARDVCRMNAVHQAWLLPSPHTAAWPQWHCSSWPASNPLAHDNRKRIHPLWKEVKRKWQLKWSVSSPCRKAWFIPLQKDMVYNDRTLGIRFLMVIAKAFGLSSWWIR